MEQASAEQAERVRQALAEVGLGERTTVSLSPHRDDPELQIRVTFRWGLPDQHELAVIWQAMELSGAEHPCWGCQMSPASTSEACRACLDGRCPGIGPRTPPRHLLRPQPGRERLTLTATRGGPTTS
jgi:hypothetical protein